MRNSILLTGGTSYIGSHIYVALAQAGPAPVIFDDFSNSYPAILERLERITGYPVVCEQGGVSDTAFVQDVLAHHAITAAVHFVGFKAIGESVPKPLDYYRNNLGGTPPACCRPWKPPAVEHWHFRPVPRCMATWHQYLSPKVFHVHTPTPMATQDWYVKTS